MSYAINYLYTNSPVAGFHYNVIRFKLNTKYFWQNVTYFRQMYQEC